MKGIKITNKEVDRFWDWLPVGVKLLFKLKLITTRTLIKWYLRYKK